MLKTHKILKRLKKVVEAEKLVRNRRLRRPKGKEKEMVYQLLILISWYMRFAEMMLERLFASINEVIELLDCI